MTSNLDDTEIPIIEAKVGQIWNEILEVPEGSGDATFFELRGDSVSAIRLVSRIEEELGVLVDVGDIFENDPDLRSFARDVAARAAGDEWVEGD